MTTTGDDSTMQLRTVADYRRAATVGSLWHCDHPVPGWSGLRIITRVAGDRLEFVTVRNGRVMRGDAAIPPASTTRFDGTGRVVFNDQPAEGCPTYTYTRLPDLAPGDRVVRVVSPHNALPGEVTHVVRFADGGVYEYDLRLADGRYGAAQPANVIPARYLDPAGVPPSICRHCGQDIEFSGTDWYHRLPSPPSGYGPLTQTVGADGHLAAPIRGAR
ncbi:MAG TPA: hypothetical protein VJT31_04240 [Rugosimonospora sp.]|nr:hypothetical protein [Rugosimonospora sp.]